MNARQCPDDLLVAARGRALSDLEQHVLSAHLARCGLCRAGELAAKLLREPRSSIGAAAEADRALIERVAECASAALARVGRRPRSTWRRAAVAAAVFLGLGGVASAWIGRSFVPPRPVDRAVVPAVPSVAPRAHRHDGTPAPAAAPVTPSRPLAPAKKPVTVRPVREPAVAAPDTPVSLFGAATRARHDGDLRRAVSLYGTLRSTFPDSDQARVASVSMGDLLFRLDEPARALRAFDSYLTDARNGPMREEALFGRARCLQKLGDETGERETWSRLVREFPGSAYGPVARQRLDELRSAR